MRLNSMRKVKMMVAAAVLLCAGTCFEAVVASDVVVGTKGNFQQVVEMNPNVLVAFTAPWCGHCKALAPEFEGAAEELKNADPPVVLMKVDATAEDSLASKYDVKGFPTLKWFRNGEASEYGGGRTHATIVSWVKKKTGPAFKELRTVDEVADLTDSDDVVVVGFLGDDHNVERKAFEDAAYSLHETPFGLAGIDLASNFDVAAPAVVVFKTFDERKAIFEGDYEKGLLKFIRDSSLPLIMEFSQENAPKIFGGDVDTHMLLFVDVNADESQIEEAKETAKLYKGEILFVTISKSDDRILEFFDVAEEDMPAIRLVHMGEGDMKKYRFKGTIHKDALTSFIEKYKSGDLVPELKSEEPPQSNDGPVKTVVGKTFDDIVLDPKRDVFVQMMAPWCGHCKRLAPVWEDLGRKLQPYDGIVIAKMDATANEHERVDISGFPTLKFWAAGAEDPVDFDGSRDMEGFVNFLKEHSSTDFDVVIDNEEL